MIAFALAFSAITFLHIVLGERGGARTPDQGVLSTHTWRVSDLGTKHALLRAGLGWGNLPEHLVRGDLARRRLVAIRPAAWSEDEWRLSLALVHRTDVILGPAARWLVEQMGQLCLKELES